MSVLALATLAAFTCTLIVSLNLSSLLFLRLSVPLQLTSRALIFLFVFSADYVPVLSFASGHVALCTLIGHLIRLQF